MAAGRTPRSTPTNGRPMSPRRAGTPTSEGVVALGRDKRAQAREVPRSDGQGEFGERCREAELCRNVGGEFVVAAAEVLHEGMAGCESCRRAEAFQSAHGPQPGLQSAVIGFDPVVAVLLGDV